MDSFCRRVVEFMYEDRLNQFISSFYELYVRYNHLGEEGFLREWFNKSIIRSLVFYFPPSLQDRGGHEVLRTGRAE